MEEIDITRSGACVLEVIACSLEDAVEAERGHADRLEVVRELNRGGLTPPLDLVRRIKEKVGLPLRVMLRESEQDVRSSLNILDNLRATLSELEKIKVDGVVLGFLREGNVDLETMGEVLSAAPRMAVTFHHAFDDTCSPLETLEALHALPQVDRVLTSGGKGDVFERAARLERYRQKAAKTLAILAGGGLNHDVLRVLRAQTSICEFHVGRAAREPVDGKVRSHLVSRLKETLDKQQSGDVSLRAEEVGG